MNELLSLLKIIPTRVLNEMIAVISDLKPSSRFNVNSFEDYQIISKKLKLFDVYSTFSDFKIVHTDNCSYTIKKTENKNNEIHFCYISKSRSIMKKLKEIDKKLNEPLVNENENFAEEHCPELGRLLGYPDCCIDAFMYARKNLSCNFVKNAYGASKQYQSFYTNYYDSSPRRSNCLISHYPCSFRCERTIDYGKKLFKIIKNIDIEYYNSIKEELIETIYYIDSSNSIKLIGNFSNYGFAYTEIQSSSNDKYLIDYFKMSNEIIVDDEIVLKKNGELIVKFDKNSKNYGMLLHFR